MPSTVSNPQNANTCEHITHLPCTYSGGTEGFYRIPVPHNEPVYNYAPGSHERNTIKNRLRELSAETVEVPLIIGGKPVTTGRTAEIRMPHKHNHVLGKYHQAGPKEVKLAIDTAMKAAPLWSSMPWTQRASIFLKAAELLSGPYRPLLNGATMLGQSKTIHQAEIDSACELIDFFRFNTYYMTQIYREQPDCSPGIWNMMEHRALEGFVLAVTPFNFTSIAGNLPTAPALMGNVVLWKPASSAMYSAYFIMKLLEEAGLPPGVINMVAGPGAEIGPVILSDPNLAGLHFTGSTAVFQEMWRTIGNNISRYKTYPRIVGETGGKDFVIAHESADIKALVTALIRGAFEYQGQKCSAASRAYIPDTIWPTVKEQLIEQCSSLKMGDITDFTNFMGAVIDRKAFESIRQYIDYARNSSEAEILSGGNCDDSVGYFIEPTIITVTNPHHKLMEEEIFGPVLTIFTYPAHSYEDTLALVNETSPYGLTGAVFARDRSAILRASNMLRHAAGNFYINDKPTGAVVGQQPFGGSRGSGTNDKAGSALNLIRWVSPRSIKENFLPPTDYRYPFMEEA